MARKTLFKFVDGESYHTTVYRDYNTIPVGSIELKESSNSRNGSVVKRFSTADIFESTDKNYLHYLHVNDYNGRKVGFSKLKEYTTEREYTKHYGDIMSTVRKDSITYVVEREGNKLRVSTYRFYKRRYVGKKYFGVEKCREYLTYNFSTKNFYSTTSYKGIGSREHRRVRTNQYGDIQQSLNRLPEPVKTFISSYLRRVYKIQVKKNLGESIINSVINHIGVVGPNHAKELMVNYYPGKKYLKKNGYNVVRAIMDSVGLKGKYYRRLINNNKELDMAKLVNTHLIIGDYVKMIPKGYFITKNRWGNTYFYEGDIDVKNIGHNVRLKITKLIIENIETGVVTNISGIIRDHIRVIKQLREYDESYRFNAKTVNELLLEHANFSENLKDYKRGFLYSYLYSDEFRSSVEINRGSVTSKLLSTTEEYNNESKRQSNCVSSYIGKRRSFIISLDIEGYVVTMEFNYKGECIQKRARFNRAIDEVYMDIVSEQERLVGIAKSEGLLVKPNLLRKNIISGVEDILDGDGDVTNSDEIEFFDDFLF